MAVQRVVLGCWSAHQKHLTDHSVLYQTLVWLLFTQHLPDVLYSTDNLLGDSVILLQV